VPIDELLARADVISLNLSLTDKTRGFLDAARVARIKRGAIEAPLHASHDARTINNSLTYSLKSCTLCLGHLRRGLSEDLFEACSKSPSFFDSPLL
jgi:hypothetical protein